MPAENTPPDPAPEIPSFRKEKEKKGFGAPLFGPATGARPALKVRGLGTGASVMDRLKQFKKKDVAFILSGLGVLFMAPLAEHFIMGPREDQSVIRPGFDNKGNPFVDVSPYEAGTGGFAPGGLPGQSADVITPLNVRDPSALVLGPGGSQQSGSVAPPPPPKRDDSFNDALNLAATKSGRAAMDSAGPPAPRPNMAGAIRGLSALSGASYGGGPSFSLPPISASNVPNTPNQSRSLSRVQSAPGYRGPASRGPMQGSNAIENLRKAAADAGNWFNRSGSAAGNLDSAAREAIPGGGRGDGGGGPGGGEQGKSPSNSSTKDNKSLGESLAYLKAKMEMEKALDLKWKKKEWREFELPKMIQTELIKGFLDGVVKKGLFEPFGELIKGLWPQPSGSAPGTCIRYGAGGAAEDSFTYTAAQRKACLDGGQNAPGSVKCDIIFGRTAGWVCTKPGGGGGDSGSGSVDKPITPPPSQPTPGDGYNQRNDQVGKVGETLQENAANIGNNYNRAVSQCETNPNTPGLTKAICQSLTAIGKDVESIGTEAKNALQAQKQLKAAHDALKAALNALKLERKGAADNLDAGRSRLEEVVSQTKTALDLLGKKPPIQADLQNAAKAVAAAQAAVKALSREKASEGDLALGAKTQQPNAGVLWSSKLALEEADAQLRIANCNLHGKTCGQSAVVQTGAVGLFKAVVSNITAAAGNIRQSAAVQGCAGEPCRTEVSYIPAMAAELDPAKTNAVKLQDMATLASQEYATMEKLRERAAAVYGLQTAAYQTKAVEIAAFSKLGKAGNDGSVTVDTGLESVRAAYEKCTKDKECAPTAETETPTPGPGPKFRTQADVAGLNGLYTATEPNVAKVKEQTPGPVGDIRQYVIKESPAPPASKP